MVREDKFSINLDSTGNRIGFHNEKLVARVPIDNFFES